MPRVHFVKKARKEHRCRNGHTINKGDSYYWAKPAWRPRMVKCQSCGSFRASELTSSGHLATLYGIQEAMADQEVTVQTMGDISSNFENWADEAEQVAEEYEESANNIEEYFEGSSQVDNIREKGEYCTEWADALRQAGEEVSELASEAEDLQTEKETLEAKMKELEEKEKQPEIDNTEYMDAQTRLEELDSEIESKLDEIREKIDDASGELQL